MIKRIVIDNNKSKYFISSDGEVYNDNGTPIKKYKDRNGYYRVYIKIPNIDKKYYRIHRLVAIMFLENPNNYNQVNHINGNKKDNRVENLEWCTASYNSKHSYSIGTHISIKGEKHKNSKYTENEINKVCEYIETGKYSNKEISKMTGVSRSIIKDIISGRAWKHISKKYDLSKSIRKKYKKYYTLIDEMLLHKKSKTEIINFLCNENIGTIDNIKYLVNRRAKRFKKLLKVILL